MILGSRALLIWPKMLLLKTVVTPSVTPVAHPPTHPGRKLFVTLNASARKSSFCPSRTWKVLDRDRSNCQVPGPRTPPEPEFPNVPIAGRANAAGFKYLAGVLSPYGFAINWFTRWLATPFNARS